MSPYRTIEHGTKESYLMAPSFWNSNLAPFSFKYCEEVVSSIASRQLTRVAIEQTLMFQQCEIHSVNDAGFQEVPAELANDETIYNTRLISDWSLVDK